ncbi:hypothetical protein SAMN02745126_00976 [Enhydrobacter aerosaccus]|uniref:GDSL-like Lipase/Acylhydrolase family protein n=1 Tax=Enhydrobacter aerosaccus TaxID=225324 RepID=A0A1T4KHH0_9HYPH|nr:hypothetical protein [Enhydrobacter aerosaccus]SJZ41878.1 hypothetical protein SAMN02745126_00976 [Enhydrobacter aerosaccus]
MITSILLSTVVAEVVVRGIDGLPLFAVPLPEGVGVAATSQQRDEIPLASGVSRDWFFDDPPPLPNRTATREDWQRLFNDVRNHPATYAPFRPADIFKAWNSVFAGDPCRNSFLKHAPGMLYLYDPPDERRVPPYRFLPDVTTPLGLVTNQIGWRGPPIVEPRAPNTIRIVFVGASTTVDGHHLPFSYPEYVGYWLNVWAKAKKLNVRFEALNAGRESITSTDIAEIVRTEVVPLRPDLVVYYEGHNQFWLPTVFPDMPQNGDIVRPTLPIETPPSWLLAATRFSDLARRIQAAIGYTGSNLDGREWPKPDYKIVMPAGLDEKNPDIADPRLPLHLDTILHDLDQIRGDLAGIDSELALSSFVWMVKDGLVLNPIRDKYILEDLNISEYPARYRDIVRLAAFQNRVFEKYAAEHHLPFIDVAHDMPLDPTLFQDAIHNTAGGVRTRAWVVLQYLIPVVERHLASGAWPKPLAKDPPPLPTFKPRRIELDCKPG